MTLKTSFSLSLSIPILPKGTSWLQIYRGHKYQAQTQADIERMNEKTMFEMNSMHYVTQILLPFGCLMKN